MDRRLTVVDWICGVAVAALACVVYATTCSVGAYPGESAREIAGCLGVFPWNSPENPVWRWIAGAAGAVAGREAVAALNGLAVACGTLAVWLVYRVTSLGLRLAILSSEAGEPRARIASIIGGLAAALFAAFSVPPWVCATRATPDAFHAVMLLSVAALFLSWCASGRFWLLIACWFLCGLGVVEFPTFIPFVPLAGGITLLRLWQAEMLTPGRVAAVAAAAVLPLALYPLAAVAFAGTDGYRLGDYGSVGQVLWVWWRGQYYFLRFGLPKVGWLLILCLTVVPWLTMLAVARHALNRAAGAGLLVLHVVLAGVIVVMLFNLRISPWRLVGWGTVMVTPYVLSATVCGYLAAYAFLLPQAWWTRDPAVRSGVPWRRDLLGCLLAGPLIAAIAVAPFRNMGEADGRRAAFVNDMAQEVVRAVGGRQWLVTDGVLDNHVLLAAREAGKPLRTVNLSDRTDVYQRQLARHFEQPLYRNLLQISSSGFAREWLAREPDAVEKVAVLSEPDLWLAAGLVAVPHRMVYLGRRRDAADAGDVAADHRAFVDGIGGWKPRGFSQPADFLGNFVARHAGAVANNTGVYLEDSGRPNEAFEAYQAARRIDPGNLSALLNLGVMVDRGFQTPEKDTIRKDLDALQKTVKQRMHAWTLSRHYGYVRIPELYVQVGWSWVLSGQPGLGVPRLLKAIELSPDQERAQAARQALAYAYMAQNEEDASEAVCKSLLEKDPSNMAALIGMARIEIRNRNLEAAASYLERAGKAGAPARATAFDWATLHIAAGHGAKARAILERIVDEDPSVARAWAMLAGILAQERDAAGVERCLQRLDGLREGRGVAAMIRGRIAMERMDVAAARRHIESAAKALPRSPAPLELLIKLDLLQSRQDAAKEHAIALLRLRPNHALANYTLGTAHLADGKLDMAEDLLRRSMAAERTPAVLNDLGWLLCSKGRYAEAEELTRAGLAMRSDMYQGWDTLAVILMRTGRLDEAEEAIGKSLALFGDDPSVHLHKAELLVLRGKSDAARRTMESIKGKRDMLPVEERMRFDQLNVSLKAGTP